MEHGCASETGCAYGSCFLIKKGSFISIAHSDEMLDHNPMRSIRKQRIHPFAAQGYGLNDYLQNHQSGGHLKGEGAVYCQPTASKLSGQDSLW